MRSLSVLVAAFLTSCAGPAHLSQDTQPVVLCIFNILNITPKIAEASVYAFGDSAVVAYQRKDDPDDIHQMFVQRRPLDNRFIATGNYMADAELGADLASQIESKCQIETGYTDQIWIGKNPRRWRLDMSRLEKEN